MNTTAHKSTIDLIAARLAGRIALAELPDDDMRALASNDGLTIDGAVFWITDSWTVYGFRSILDDTSDYVDTECPIPGVDR
jgi:hypothetical protein